MKSKTIKAISITRTEEEWRIIDDKLICLGKKDLSIYIRCEIYKLKNKINTNGEIARRIEKRPYLPIESINELQKLSLQMKMPVGAIINQLIISPLLKPDNAIAI